VLNPSSRIPIRDWHDG